MATISADPSAAEDIERLVEARLHDPFKVLGAHRDDTGWTVRVFRPDARKVSLETAGGRVDMQRTHPAGVFEWRGWVAPPVPYRLRTEYASGTIQESDAYAFQPRLPDSDVYLFNSGELHQGYRLLGAIPVELDGVPGIRFAVWAPNAERVSVVGDFNHWDGRRHPMQSQGGSGIWALFLPELPAGTLYKFEIRSRVDGSLQVKSDPYGRRFEMRPGTATVAVDPGRHAWEDAAWLEARARSDWLHAPCNIYEVHAGSWRRHADGRFLSYRELADVLVPYLADLNYTHVELMPLSEHPLDESWGYQTTGYFAPTSRFGSPDDLRYLVDRCHRAGIGVILDWVPAHFPRDAFALARFDGTALYEHDDPRLGQHRDWGTLIFNYGRNEVKSFLLSSAHFWLSEFHIDGLRVDAVASMLYLDYSREQGEWLPNKFGGRENLEAIDFLRALNIMVHDAFPGALTFAEESTAWPMVSRPVYVGGLGFSMKWNMGWMNDTLRFMQQDPIYRRYHHGELTFGQLYAYTENFVLPFSHDEVVHGKRSLLEKMPGDDWQRFANLRLLKFYQTTTPGKKLTFMGNEFGQGQEWDSRRSLDWDLLRFDLQRGVQNLERDLNHLYRDVPALHELDFSADGFQWIDCHDADNSVLSFIRRSRDGTPVVAVLNFTPVVRHGYRIGLPRAGAWREALNSDSSYYAGSNTGNGHGIEAGTGDWMNQPASAVLTLPPLAGLLLVPSA